MRKFQNQTSRVAKRETIDESKRRDLKRIAAFVGFAFAVAAIGCQSTKNQKESRTLDEFLGSDKPS